MMIESKSKPSIEEVRRLMLNKLVRRTTVWGSTYIGIVSRVELYRDYKPDNPNPEFGDRIVVMYKPQDFSDPVVQWLDRGTWEVYS